MKKNMGIADRVLRVVLAIIFIYLYYTGTNSGITGILLIVLASIFLLTSLIGNCPLYSLLGVKTCKTK